MMMASTPKQVRCLKIYVFNFKELKFFRKLAVKKTDKRGRALRVRVELRGRCGELRIGPEFKALRPAPRDAANRSRRIRRPAHAEGPPFAVKKTDTPGSARTRMTFDPTNPAGLS